MAATREELLDAVKACYDYWIACIGSYEDIPQEHRNSDDHAATHKVEDTPNLSLLANIACVKVSSIMEKEGMEGEWRRTQ